MGKGGDSEGMANGSRSNGGKGKTEKGKRRKEDERRGFCCDGKGHIKPNCPQKTIDDEHKYIIFRPRSAPDPDLKHSRRRIQ